MSESEESANPSEAFKRRMLDDGWTYTPPEQIQEEDPEVRRKRLAEEDRILRERRAARRKRLADPQAQENHLPPTP